VKADRVTGPMGAFVQGAPRRPFNDYNNNDHRGGGGDSYGSGGSGFGGSF
jgi:hypothetical protein